MSHVKGRSYEQGDQTIADLSLDLKADISGATFDCVRQTFHLSYIDSESCSVQPIIFSVNVTDTDEVLMMPNINTTSVSVSLMLPSAFETPLIIVSVILGVICITLVAVVVIIRAKKIKGLKVKLMGTKCARIEGAKMLEPA